jgi:hypothetical protein
MPIRFLATRDLNHMCSPSIPQNQGKWDKDEDVTSCPATTRSECSISMLALVSSDDALSCHSEVSFDGDENMEQEDVGRWFPSSRECRPMIITIPPPQLPMRESRWNATISKTTIDSPPMYYNIHRKRLRPAELPCCALDVPFRAPIRSSEFGETSSSSTHLVRPQRLADSCAHPPNCQNRSNNDYDIISLQRTIDFLDAALEIVSDDANVYY